MKYLHLESGAILILIAQIAPDQLCAFIYSISTDKIPGVILSVRQRPQALMVGEKEPKSNHCQTFSATLLKMESSSCLQAKDIKAAKPKSYMSPTTSFMAKMSRSVSMGENLCFSGGSENQNEVKISPQVSEKTRLNLLEDTEKNKPFVKDNSPVKPSLQQTASSSSPNSFHSKLASSRAHLTLDIPKPLPDRPVLASFSPKTKSKTVLGSESPQSPGTVGKKKQSFPEGWALKLESQASGPLGLGKNSPLSSCADTLKENQTQLRPKAQLEPRVTNFKLKEPSDELHSNSPEKLPLECRDKVATTSYVPANDEGCAFEQSGPRSPTNAKGFGKDSGVNRYLSPISFTLFCLLSLLTASLSIMFLSI